MEDGAIAFCPSYKVYKLKTDVINYQIQDHGIYREIDWEGKHTRATCFTDDKTKFSIDGLTVGIKNLTDRSFESLQVNGEGLLIEIESGGTIQTKLSEVKIKLN